MCILIKPSEADPLFRFLELLDGWVLIHVLYHVHPMMVSLIFLIVIYQQRIEAVQGRGRLMLCQELFGGDLQSVSGLPDLGEKAQLPPLPGWTLYLFLQFQALIELPFLLLPFFLHPLLHLSELLDADLDGLIPLILVLRSPVNEMGHLHRPVV